MQKKIQIARIIARFGFDLSVRIVTGSTTVNRRIFLYLNLCLLKLFGQILIYATGNAVLGLNPGGLYLRKLLVKFL